MADPGQITALLVRCKTGEKEALGALMSLLYDELYDLADRHMQKEFRRGHTLGATALVNEAYLKLVSKNTLAASHRNEFLAFASQTMRHILVDYARTKKRMKRGGGVQPVELERVEHLLTSKEADEVLALDEALNDLAAINERAALIIQYRFYGGLTLHETAELLGVSVKTVQRTWDAARAWLRNKVSQELLA